MKRVFVFSGLFLCFASPAWCSIFIVQKATGTSCSSCSSNTVSPPSATLQGDLLVVVPAWCSNAVNVNSVTDNKSNTWVHAPNSRAFSVCAEDTWYCKNCVGGVTTVTVNLSGSVGFVDKVPFVEYGGADINNPLDISSSTNSGATGTSNVCQSLTTNYGGDVVIDAAYPTASFTAVSAGFTIELNAGQWYSDNFTSSAGSYAATYTQCCGGGTYSCSVSAFKPVQVIVPSGLSINGKTTILGGKVTVQ